MTRFKPAPGNKGCGLDLLLAALAVAYLIVAAVTS